MCQEFKKGLAEWLCLRMSRKSQKVVRNGTIPFYPSLHLPLPTHCSSKWTLTVHCVLESSSVEAEVF